MLDLAFNLFSHVHGFNFPKYHHAVAHLMLFIEQAGSPNNGRAGVFEIRHNDVHDLYLRTNKRDFLPQMCKLV